MTNLFRVKLGQYIISAIEKLQLANAQIIPILYEGDKMFLRNFFDIAKSHEKTASRSVDVKNICPESTECTRFPLPP